MILLTCVVSEKGGYNGGWSFSIMLAAGTPAHLVNCYKD